MDLNAKKPNFFIIGAAKAGTTTLFDLLNQHPEVYLPFKKEPAFFCDDDYFIKGEKWYLNSFFKQAQSQPARGEATSRYLFHAEKVAPRIHQFSFPQSPKFIVIFRDPAKLVHSFYWHSLREGYETLPFHEALTAEENRMKLSQQKLNHNGLILYSYSAIAKYASQLQHYLTIFPKEQFLFLLTDDLKNYAKTIINLQNFLELSDQAIKIQPKESNPAALPRIAGLHQWLRNPSQIKNFIKVFFPYSMRYKLKTTLLELNLKTTNPAPLDAETANLIRKQYAEETKQLQEIIQRDLSDWLPK